MRQFFTTHSHSWRDVGLARQLSRRAVKRARIQSLVLLPVLVGVLVVYGYRETFYNFRGLRAYKDKFDPVWDPRYLAYPGGLALPRILADVSALIAGGYRRIFLKK